MERRTKTTLENLHHLSNIGSFEGRDIHCITLQNELGTLLKVFTFGAIWHSLELLDKNGELFDVVVAPKSLEDYIRQRKENPYYFGASIGRYTGRIAKGHFKMEGVTYQLPVQNKVHLHGGPGGLHSKIWDIESMDMGNEGTSVTLACTSQHMEEGYPGTISVKVTYTLTHQNDVRILYEADSDRDTIVNLTNHVYFNLDRESVLQQECKIGADSILETHEDLIPTGNRLAVNGTPYDFNICQPLRKIASIQGLDDCYVFHNGDDGPKAQLVSPNTGIQMEMDTDQPAVVVFTPHQLRFAGSPKQKRWHAQDFPAICFEAQHFPDSPNHPHFPTTVLKKGSLYRNYTSYAFKVMA
ncbi:MAG: aldose epimerase family protein, partial [Flavobacteriaceae bacterium]